MKHSTMLYLVIGIFFGITSLYGMQEIAHSTGSALIVGGSAFFLQGLYNQHEVFIERLSRARRNHVPLRLDDWVKKTAIPVLGGGAMVCVGVFLMVTNKLK